MQRRSSRRASPRRRARRATRRATRAYSGGGLRAQMTSIALGGFGVGFLESNFGDKIPSLPIVGRKGAIALGIAMINPKNKIAQDVGKAAAAISGYELGSTGAITGDYEDPYVGWVDDDEDDEDDDNFITT